MQGAVLGKRYDWSNGPSPIESHSIIKHEVLVDYLIRYIERRTTVFTMETFRLTLVDGFCGGGQYQCPSGTGLIFGSPLRMIKAIEACQAALRQSRGKDLVLDVRYIFVDKDKTAIDFLRQLLVHEGYGKMIDSTIFLLNSAFTKVADQIISFVHSHTPRKGKALFFLDQYGYKEVPKPLITKIFQQIDKAEIVLNFNAASLANFINDEIAANLERKIGMRSLRDIFGGRTIQEIKGTIAGSRKLIQAGLYESLVHGCNANYYTPFFIKGKKGHGEYWLVHLSQHHRARDVMSQVNWDRKNSFIHYGGPSLGMLELEVMGFDQRLDDHNDSNAYLFDEDARGKTLAAMVEDLGRLLKDQDQPTSFQQLFSRLCNSTPADADLFKQALIELSKAGDISIKSKDGKARETALRIHDDDIVTSTGQIWLLPR